jgi:hypothetical protein
MDGPNQPGAASPQPGSEALPAAAASPSAADGAAAAAPAAAAAIDAGAAAQPAAPAADAAKPAAAAAAPAAAAGQADPAAKPGNDFAPSLLDAAVADKKDGGADAAAAKSDAKPGDAAAAKPGDAKPGETAKPEPGKDGAVAAEAAPAPIEYAFSYPEGVSADSVNKESMGKFTGVLNEARVKPENAQKLLDLHLSEVGEIGKKLAQGQWDVFNAQQNRWRDEVMADPVLGGARHHTAIREVMGVVDAYAGETAERQALLDAFRTTGIANNPHFLRFLHRASLDLTREAAPHPAPPPRSAAPTGQQRGLNRYARTTPGR